MGIESNKEAYQMVKNTLGSIENRFREAYNKGYKDGLRDGASQVTAKLVSKILEETEADTPQTDLVKDSPSLVKGLVNKGLAEYTPPTDGVEWEDYVPFKVKEPLNHVGIIRGETDCAWK